MTRSAKANPFIVGPSDTAPPKRPRKRAPEKFTLADAFSPFIQAGDLKGQPGDTFDLERGLRSIAFLLHDLTDFQDHDLDRLTAVGLGNALDHYANRIGQLAKNRSLKETCAPTPKPVFKSRLDSRLKKVLQGKKP